MPKAQCLQIYLVICGPTQSLVTAEPLAMQETTIFFQMPFPSGAALATTRADSATLQLLLNSIGLILCHDELPRDTHDNEALFLS